MTVPMTDEAAALFAKFGIHPQRAEPCILGHSERVLGEHQPTCLQAFSGSCEGCWLSARRAPGSGLCHAHLDRVRKALALSPLAVSLLFQMAERGPSSPGLSDVPVASQPGSRVPASLGIVDVTRQVVSRTIAFAYQLGWKLAPMQLTDKRLAVAPSLEESVTAVSAACDYLLGHIFTLTTGSVAETMLHQVLGRHPQFGEWTLEQAVHFTEADSQAVLAQKPCPACDRFPVHHLPSRGPSDPGPWHCTQCGWSSNPNSPEWVAYFATY